MQDIVIIVIYVATSGPQISHSYCEISSSLKKLCNSAEMWVYISQLCICLLIISSFERLSYSVFPPSLPEMARSRFIKTKKSQPENNNGENKLRKSPTKEFCRLCPH